MRIALCQLGTTVDKDENIKIATKAIKVRSSSNFALAQAFNQRTMFKPSPDRSLLAAYFRPDLLVIGPGQSCPTQGLNQAGISQL